MDFLANFGCCEIEIVASLVDELADELEEVDDVDADLMLFDLADDSDWAIEDDEPEVNSALFEESLLVAEDSFELFEESLLVAEDCFEFFEESLLVAEDCFEFFEEFLLVAEDNFELLDESEKLETLWLLREDFDSLSLDDNFERDFDENDPVLVLFEVLLEPDRNTDDEDFVLEDLLLLSQSLFLFELLSKVERLLYDVQTRLFLRKTFLLNLCAIIIFIIV